MDKDGNTLDTGDMCVSFKHAKLKSLSLSRGVVVELMMNESSKDRQTNRQTDKWINTTVSCPLFLLWPSKQLEEIVWLIKIYVRYPKPSHFLSALHLSKCQFAVV